MASDKPLITVIIPTYNNADLLAETLDSILSQSYSPIEVIVVNDGSTDNTSNVLRSFKQLIVFDQVNQGDVPARNQGIKLSTGSMIAFCDSDDVWERDHLKNLASPFAANKDLGMAFDNVVYFNGRQRVKEQCGTFDEKYLLIKSKLAKRLARSAVPLRAFFDDNLITTSCFMVRREVFNRVGVFDNNIFLMNDLHLFYRIGTYFEVRFVDYVGVWKRVHEANLTVVNPSYEFGVNCLEDIKSNYPEVYRKIGARRFYAKLGKKYVRLARHYDNLGMIEKASETYRKALGYRPFDIRCLWRCVRDKVSIKSDS